MFCFVEDLLQKKVFSRASGSHEYLTIVPEGNWRTVEHGAEKYRLTLRRYIVIMFHETALGPHRDRDRTVQAIHDAGVWWRKLYTDVNAYIRQCLVCSSAKSRPMVTGHQRSRDYDGPFRYLLIDFVGPMTPTSRNGNRYMFTCACAWSGWYWAIPCKENKSEDAAHCLFYYVICDLAGYPVCLGCDNDRAFTEGIIKHLVNHFGISHVIGTAYHPQSQSAVERPHREYNAMCKTFMRNYAEWDVVVPVFVWTVRTTAKLFNGQFTPYEVVTGMKPRSPIDPLLSSPTGVQRVSVEKYVNDLCDYLRKIHKLVESEHGRIREDSQRRKYRELGSDGYLSVGDYVLVKKEPDKGVSARFQDKTFDYLYLP